jgi:alkylation response protein AidB-like acyl-CoA dehydrogenase
MPESLSSEHKALATAATAFARTTLATAGNELAQGVDAALVRAQVRNASLTAGFFRMTQPRAFGGSEASPLALTVVREALAATNTGLAHWVFGPGPGVLAGVGEPLKSTHLRPLLAGEARAAFAFTEPDDASQFTTATMQGEELSVTGKKSYVTGGADADFLNTLVDVPPHGRAMLVIDCATPGVVMERRFQSMDGSHHAAFRFDNARVPANHIIGKAGEGLPRAMRQIGDTRLAIAADAVGTCIWIVDFVTAHLKAPHYSGEPLGAKEGVRLRYADLRIATYAARSLLYRTARLAEAGANIVNEGICAKVFATETLAKVVDTAIQLVGGKALTVGHPLEKLYRSARALRLTEGASDVLRLNLARGRLDLDKGVL